MFSRLFSVRCPSEFVRIFTVLHCIFKLQTEMKKQLNFNRSLSKAITTAIVLKRGDFSSPINSPFSLLWLLYLHSRIVKSLCSCVSEPQVKSLTWHVSRLNQTFSSYSRVTLPWRCCHRCSYEKEHANHNGPCKIKFMYTPLPEQRYVETNIILDSFVYLGRTRARDGSLDPGIKLRIENVSKALGKLQKKDLVRHLSRHYDQCLPIACPKCNLRRYGLYTSNMLKILESFQEK